MLFFYGRRAAQFSAKMHARPDRKRDANATETTPNTCTPKLKYMQDLPKRARLEKKHHGDGDQNADAGAARPTAATNVRFTPMADTSQYTTKAIQKIVIRLFITGIGTVYLCSWDKRRCTAPISGECFHKRCDDRADPRS